MTCARKQPCFTQLGRVSEVYFRAAREGSVQRNCRKQECMSALQRTFLQLSSHSGLAI
jgi:hypothetical protein